MLHLQLYIEMNYHLCSQQCTYLMLDSRQQFQHKMFILCKTKL